MNRRPPEPHSFGDTNCLATLAHFIESKESSRGISPSTKTYYLGEIGAFLRAVNKAVDRITLQDIEHHLASLTRSPGGRDARYRALWAFWSWLHKRGYVAVNPFSGKDKLIERPKLPKLVLPHHTAEQLATLIINAPTTRDKALVSLLADSGARLNEALNVKLGDIDWQERAIKVMGKGAKERFIPFGEATEMLLRGHLATYDPNGGSIWGLNRSGIHTMLRRLEARTGITCNPHTFRRTFAMSLRDSGVDALAIKELGGWESLEMVLRYTRGYDSRQARKHYVSPVSLSKSTLKMLPSSISL